ncbi:MAG: IS5 family transposase [Cytophagaceae bacterium]|nr:MAG: IS5 family transposase [Cytophagaceae bacterium]
MNCSSPSRWIWWAWWTKKNEIGRSLKGFSSKIHTVVDSRGRAIFYSISPGQEPDCIRAPLLIPHALGKTVIADKGYDSTRVARAIESRGMVAMIPCRSTRVFPRKIDYRVYRRRITIERSFHRLKRYRGLATRYCKTAICFLSLVQLASVAIWWL